MLYVWYGGTLVTKGLRELRKLALPYPIQGEVELVGAGLGEDLDEAVDWIGVVLGGVGILVDADLANAVAGWKRASGEAVDVEFGRVAAGESVELLLELVRVERKLIDVCAFEDDGIAVLVWVGCGGIVVGNIDLLGGDDHFQLDVERPGGSQGHGLRDVGGEALHVEDDYVARARVGVQRVAAVAIGGGGTVRAFVGVKHDAGIRDDGAGGIGDQPGETRGVREPLGR